MGKRQQLNQSLGSFMYLSLSLLRNLKHNLRKRFLRVIRWDNIIFKQITLHILFRLSLRNVQINSFPYTTH